MPYLVADNMKIDGLKRKLCRDFLVEADITDFGSVAITSFTYPDGDSVNLYFSEFKDAICASDEGATLAFLQRQGVEIHAERRATIKTMCQPYDVEFAAPALRKQFQMPDIGNACLSLCEAITRVASIHYQVISPIRSSLPIAVDKLLKKRVAPKRGIEKGWVNLRHDPKGAFPVDFHLNGVGQPRNIFAVTSPSKSIMVVAVVNFLRSHRMSTPTLAVVDKDADLGEKDLNRLQLTVNEFTFGLDGNEDKVVKFALGEKVP
ncbi:MAG: DUF1828 domain-containing protein [Tepidisphaeraceae bacterium]